MTPISPVLSSPAASREANTTARPTRFSSASLQSELDRRKSIDSVTSSSAYEAGMRQHTVSLGPSVSPIIGQDKAAHYHLAASAQDAAPRQGAWPPPSFILTSEDLRPPLAIVRDLRLDRHRRRRLSLFSARPHPPSGRHSAVPGRGAYNMGSLRQHGSSLPPNAGSMRQPPVDDQFPFCCERCELWAGVRAAALPPRRYSKGACVVCIPRRRYCQTRRMPLPTVRRSHLTSTLGDATAGNTTISAASGGLPSEMTPGRAANTSTGSTDPSIIHAITQTMIG